MGSNLRCVVPSREHEQLEKIKPRIQRRWARATGNKTTAAIDQLVKEKPLMHLVLKDTPGFDEIRSKIGAGVGEGRPETCSGRT